ncbi:hypothetical protein GOP47_0007504 [Adiantum capillus-veneris]|uniref:Uncharacterized protein n=1 Tax=Adiantum capillus-veneris TaxID=13818 RepID=A0A9D4ZM02_ADICA|nr:hypothetical protein GOP47_0007504 [Adiantum capillus-veneris]
MKGMNGNIVQGPPTVNGLGFLTRNQRKEKGFNRTTLTIWTDHWIISISIFNLKSFFFNACHIIMACIIQLLGGNTEEL